MADGMDEFLRRHGRPMMIAFECDIVTSGINDPADTVDCRERNGNKMLHRDCLWSPQPGSAGPLYPAAGDRALVILSDEDQPWIVEWSPYA